MKERMADFVKKDEKGCMFRFNNELMRLDVDENGKAVLTARDENGELRKFPVKIIKG